MTNPRYFSTMLLPSGKVLTLMFMNEDARNAVSEAAGKDRLVDADVEELQEYRTRVGSTAEEMLRKRPANV